MLDGQANRNTANTLLYSQNIDLLRENEPCPIYIVDGERIEGSWRHIFLKNGSTYFLTDLKVYADGLIDC